MKKHYTIDELSQFFGQFKQLPEYYELEKVRLLINSPGAMAKQKGKPNVNLLKFLMVTSWIITSALVVLFWMKSNKDHSPVSNYNLGSQKKETPGNIHTESLALNSTPSPAKKQQNNIPEQISITGQTSDLPPDTITTGPARDLSANSSRNADCSWPKDTVIDKHRLFIYLTNEELVKLGVFHTKNKLYYNNKGKVGSFAHIINAKLDKQKFTVFDFNLVYVSDTACTTYLWGHSFYDQIDILVPVVIRVSNKLKILWFNSNNAFFSAVPERYRYLQSIYQQLKCVRRRNPGHRIVNYCDPKKNIVLDTIPYLKFTKAELQSLGVGIFKDSIILIDSTQTYRFKIRLNGGSHSTHRKKGEVLPDIPSIFPAMITDVKGLNQASFGRWANKQKQKNNQYSSDVFNTLIPVCLPVSDFIKERKYSLILWYYPTDRFLNALPKRYRKEITSEIEYINSSEKNGQPSSSCTYFEACKSTLTLDDLKIFPNPASIEATIEFSLSTDVTGKISLVNISGIELRLLLPQNRFLAGFNTFKLNLDGVPPGIYLVSIITDKGFKTQRIIITR